MISGQKLGIRRSRPALPIGIFCHSLQPVSPLSTWGPGPKVLGPRRPLDPCPLPSGLSLGLEFAAISLSSSPHPPRPPCCYPSSCLIPFPFLSLPPTSSLCVPSYPPILSFPPPLGRSCCLAHSIYSGICRVITIKLLKGDNPAKEASLTPSPLLSLVWCSPAPPFPEASCSHPTPHFHSLSIWLCPCWPRGKENGSG